MIQKWSKIRNTLLKECFTLPKELLQNISKLPKSGWNTLHLFLITFWKWKSSSHVLFFATHGLYSPWNSPGQNTGVRYSPNSPGDLPNPGIEPRSPTLQVDSLPAEPQGKPKNTGVGSLSLPQWIFLTQESNWGPLHCRQILYQLSYQESSIIYQKQTKVGLSGDLNPGPLVP